MRPGRGSWSSELVEWTPREARSFLPEVLLAVAAAACFVANELHLALVLTSVLPVVAVIRRATSTQMLTPRLLVVAFAAGNVFSWGVGSLMCRVADLEIGRHVIWSLVLLNAVTWGAMLGSMLVRGRERWRAELEVSSSFSAMGVRVAGAVMLAYASAQVSEGYLVGREIGTVSQPGSPLYFLNALTIVFYPFFFFLGTRTPSRFKVADVSRVLLVLALMGGVSLQGGREYSARIALVYMLGCALSPAGVRGAVRVGLWLIPSVILLLLVVGMARDAAGFGRSSVEDRLTALSEASRVIAESSGASSEGTGPLALLASRVMEPTGQMVVDRVHESGSFAGWENAERLFYLFVPLFIAGEKQRMDDGPEVLARDYGVTVTIFTSSPITFLADAFRRGGLPAVWILSALVGMWLTQVERHLVRLGDPGVMVLAVLATPVLRLYPLSVMGLVSAVTYAFARDILVLLLMTKAIVWLQHRSGSPAAAVA